MRKWMRLVTTTFRSEHACFSTFREKVSEGPQLHDFLLRQSEKATDDSVAQLELMLEQVKQIDQEKLLEDSFGRKHTYLRLSLTERCNLRCNYCMPEAGVPLQAKQNLLTNPEIIRLTKLFAKAGVNKIRLTGGEPMVRKDIVDLTSDLSHVDGIESVGITSNGISLGRKLEDLKKSGLTHLNISLDTLVKRKFEKITRRKGFDRVMDSIHQAVTLGYHPVKINCVVMRGFNDQEIVDFVELTRNVPIDVRFIEWMPFDSNRWDDDKFVSYEDMMGLIAEKYDTNLINKLEDDPNHTSKGYQVEGFQGQFGFITSMSQHFCGTCNRLRITADGNLKVCLFGNSEVSLRDAMRTGFSDDEIGLIIKCAVNRKKFSLGGHKNMYAIAKSENRPMILIGG